MFDKSVLRGQEKDCLKSEAALLTECKNEAVAELVDRVEEVGIFLRSS